ncbi:MAG: hypothetical protein VX822_04475 [Candidatus Neomarinimicrobiota bacterium]|nr:hypothetical protein [Candidatus Neomarinimicrobiota bacterium]
MKLHFDVRDIFQAPRIALGGKKVWLLLQVNLVGYVAYFLFTHIAFLVNGRLVSDVWAEYGLYPCLIGSNYGITALVIWLVGVLTWVVVSLLGYTAVARVTYKQLKGDEFYSSSDAWKFVKKHWHAPVFTHLSIIIIALFFMIMAAVFALIGKIPFLGELFFGIPYLLWFFGSVFVVYTTLVLIVANFFTPAIVGAMEEDTMGAVFQNYSITWSQPWRTLLYTPLIYSLLYIAVVLFAYFAKFGYQLINIVFGHDLLMGSKLSRMVGWATDMVVTPICDFGSALPFSAGFFSMYLPDSGGVLGPMEYIGASFIALSLFLIVGTVISYAMSVEVVAQTIAVVIFRMKTDEENLLERKDEEELELENDDDWSFDDSDSDSEDDQKEDETDDSKESNGSDTTGDSDNEDSSEKS